MRLVETRIVAVNDKDSGGKANGCEKTKERRDKCFEENGEVPWVMELLVPAWLRFYILNTTSRIGQRRAGC